MPEIVTSRTEEPPSFQLFRGHPPFLDGAAVELLMIWNSRITDRVFGNDRHHPEESPEAVKQEFANYVHHAAQLDQWLRNHPPQLDWKVHWPPYSIDVDHPICQAVAKAHDQAAVGTRFEGPARYSGFAAVCDAAFLDRDGVPSVVYGPGSVLVAHAPDEYIEIDELITATTTYALVTMDWCGLG